MLFKKIKLINFIIIFIIFLSCNISADIKGDGNLKLSNYYTHESLNVNFKDKFGNFIPEALKKLDWFFRSYYDNRIMKIDRKLYNTLDNVQDHFDKNKEIILVSGYRSREFNGNLHRSSRRVASRSFHMFGRAVDFRVSGIDIFDLKKYAKNLRAGGFGCYPSKGNPFIHMDTGPVRTW